jgi:hypothetical protein
MRARSAPAIHRTAITTAFFYIYKHNIRTNMRPAKAGPQLWLTLAEGNAGFTMFQRKFLVALNQVRS